MPARVIHDAETVDRLAKLLGMLGSDSDGEVVNAGRAADRLLRSVGLTWFDVIVQPISLSPPEPEHEHEHPDDWRYVVLFCRVQSSRLTARERGFIRSMERWRGNPTDKQLDWLFAIYDHLRGAS